MMAVEFNATFTEVNELNATFGEVIQVSGDSRLDDFIEGALTEIISDADSVRDFAFYYYPARFSVSLPNATSIGSQAFDNSLIVEASLPELTGLPNRSFYRCSALESIYVPKVETITGGSPCFADCTSLTRAEFPSLTSINNRTHFSGCTALEYVDFNVVPLIQSSGMFTNCSSLVALVLRKTDAITTLSSADAFSGTPIAGGTGYVYVPDDLIDSYKVAAGWSAYATQIKGLSQLPS